MATKKFIDTDTAKVAGPLADLLQKMQHGQITLAHIKGLNGMTFAQRESVFPDGKLNVALIAKMPAFHTEKFALLKDLGVIVVPDDYDHPTALERFFEENRKKFYLVNNDTTDKNFSNPSRILKPGDKLRVRAFHQIVGGSTTSQERMAYLEQQNAAVYTGAQGSSLVFEQKRNDLPKDKRYASFDEKDRLPLLGGDQRVPFVGAHSGGDFYFGLGGFWGGWRGDDVFLGFSDYVEPAQAGEQSSDAEVLGSP